MRHLVILYLLLLCPMGIQAQSTAEAATDSIMNYLADHCLDGFVTIESNGRNHAKRGEFVIDNQQMEATGRLVRGMRHWLDLLPHQRKMTEERAGEVFEGRIAMRLQPEAGDTSAYFIMTYNRSKVTFKYGVNSPGSISLSKSPATGLGVSHRHKELPAAEANPVISLFEEYSRRNDAYVVDTLFQYDGDKGYEWWQGATGENSKTKARIVLLPSREDREIQQWWDMFCRYRNHDDVTTGIKNSVWQGKAYLQSAICTFNSGGAFHLYLAGNYNGQFCLVRVIAQPGEPCEVVPEFARLIKHMNGGEQQIPDKTGNPERLVTLMETELQRLQSHSEAQVLDTFFVSNDHEGHIWWVNIDGSCPTRARLVRASSSEQDFDALHQRIRKSLDDVVYYQAWTDDGDEDKRIFIGWTDERQLRHAYIVYYFTSTRQLVIERADGEEPFSICIPHYRHDWFR